MNQSEFRSRITEYQKRLRKHEQELEDIKQKVDQAAKEEKKEIELCHLDNALAARKLKRDLEDQLEIIQAFVYDDQPFQDGEINDTWAAYVTDYNQRITKALKAYHEQKEKLLQMLIDICTEQRKAANYQNELAKWLPPDKVSSTGMPVEFKAAAKITEDIFAARDKFFVGMRGADQLIDRPDLRRVL